MTKREQQIFDLIANEPTDNHFAWILAHRIGLQTKSTERIIDGMVAQNILAYATVNGDRAVVLPKRYALISPSFGRQFTFNAGDVADAVSKAKGWCLYHSFCYNDGYRVEEVPTDDPMQDLHNEYLR